jgi:hypothetical protein
MFEHCLITYSDPEGKGRSVIASWLIVINSCNESKKLQYCGY